MMAASAAPALAAAAEADDDDASAATSSCCPICLYRQPDAAVLPCVHFFCERCALSWFVALGKRPCPLCKVPGEALLTRISADGRAFSERRLGGTGRRPSRWEQEGQQAAEAAALALAAAARAAAQYHARLLPAPRSSAASNRPPALPDEQQQQQDEEAPPIDGRRAFYRAVSPPPPPISPAADSRPRALSAASAAAAPRVRQFARRDLRALLLVEGEDGDEQGDDETVALLLEHALGLLRAHGPAPLADAAAAENEDPDRAAIATLQPLLFEHASRFWAELSAFARSGLSVEAFDRLRREQGRTRQQP
jgi:hypothetical protein